MTPESRLAFAAQAVMGKAIWRAWQGVGSNIFFEIGEPTTWVSKLVRSRLVNGVNVERRRAAAYGSHGIHIEMAEWQVYSGNSLVADSEASDEVFDQLLNWLEGQHLVELRQHGPTLVSLRFDLKARFELTPPPDAKPDYDLLSIKTGPEVTSLRADGDVVTEPWGAEGD